MLMPNLKERVQEKSLPGERSPTVAWSYLNLDPKGERVAEKAFVEMVVSLRGSTHYEPLVSSTLQIPQSGANPTLQSITSRMELQSQLANLSATHVVTER